MYKLRQSLTGHEQDVKDVTVVGDRILSCSRDGTVRSWDANGDSRILFHSSTNSFINALCALPDQMYASGGKDNVIFINSSESTEPTDMGLYNLIGHQNNICHLHYGDGVLISSSWDGTAKVWNLDDFSCKYTLKTESYMSVLCSLVVGPEKFLTCSADKQIRLWQGEKIINSFSGHTDVVRSLVMLNEEVFASSSNDGTIKIWDLSGNLISTLTGHESFIYDIAVLPNGNLVSCGEDRSVRIWSLENDSLLQTITLPCISNWCLALLGEDIVVGSSDNYVRIFTKDESKFASKEELEQFEESVRNSTISEQSVDINKTDVPGYERLNTPGKEGQTVMVKNNVGVIEAHQWSNNQWNKIGDVVSATGSSSKKEYQGKMYDYVFDVDVEDGKPPLKLPFNAGDNVYTVANKFLADNELPSSYVQEVVNFIEKNTEGVNITETSASNASSANETSTKPSHELVVIPVKDFILFKDINNNQLVKGLTKFNEGQQNKLSFIPNQFDVSSSEAVDLILGTVTEIFKWEETAYLIGFDLLRVLIPKLGINDILKNEELPEIILGFINKGVESNNPSVLMMMLKFLSNLSESILFIQIFITTDDSLVLSKDFLDKLNKLKNKQLDVNHKHYNQFLVSYATLLFNISVACITKKIKSDVSQFMFATTNEEANYRFLITLGNLKYVKLTKKSVGDLGLTPESKEKRFVDIMKDLEVL